MSWVIAKYLNVWQEGCIANSIANYNKYTSAKFLKMQKISKKVLQYQKKCNKKYSMITNWSYSGVFNKKIFFQILDTYISKKMLWKQNLKCDTLSNKLLKLEADELYNEFISIFIEIISFKLVKKIQQKFNNYSKSNNNNITKHIKKQIINNQINKISGKSLSKMLLYISDYEVISAIFKQNQNYSWDRYETKSGKYKVDDLLVDCIHNEIKCIQILINFNILHHTSLKTIIPYHKSGITKPFSLYLPFNSDILQY